MFSSLVARSEIVAGRERIVTGVIIGIKPLAAVTPNPGPLPGGWVGGLHKGTVRLPFERRICCAFR